jgi:hypothetical protein
MSLVPAARPGALLRRLAAVTPQRAQAPSRQKSNRTANFRVDRTGEH